MTLSDEVALLALSIERAGTDPEAVVCVRLEFESLWLKFRADTQKIYDDFVVEAREEFDIEVAQDRREAMRDAAYDKQKVEREERG